ncbi:MAG TPA: MFS transporter [Burkholderiales bacterium]
MEVAAPGSSPRSRRILPAIVAAQFAGTSLWFAGNAVLPDLQRDWGLHASALGTLTSAVQLGFIAGTLVFAFLALADRFSPRRVYLAASLAGAGVNLLATAASGLELLVVLRFLAGFTLAGIYPVGMKIASGWYREGLGRAMGYLVGALVVGTALPHLIKALGGALPWQAVMASVSLVAAAGGCLMYLAVPDGPYLGPSARFDPRALGAVFASPRFRASAFGYFGHMWELYAFWAFVPVALAAHAALQGVVLEVSLWTFVIIAAGFAGCAAGGLASLRLGSAPVAAGQLAFSGLCCLVSPLAFFAPTPLYVAFLVAWGVAVVGDSPQFSTLNAQNAPREGVGAALTIVNCIGFAITIPAIELLNALATRIPVQWLFVVLAAGPALGLLALRPLLSRSRG